MVSPERVTLDPDLASEVGAGGAFERALEAVPVHERQGHDQDENEGSEPQPDIEQRLSARGAHDSSSHP
jgi:hypothetical protein